MRNCLGGDYQGHTKGLGQVGGPYKGSESGCIWICSLPPPLGSSSQSLVSSNASVLLGSFLLDLPQAARPGSSPALE